MEEVQNKDLRLISKIIESKDFLTPRRRGIKKEMMEGAGRKLWEYISDFFEKYNTLPSSDTINGLLVEANIKLWPVQDPLDYLCEEILNRDTYEKLKKLQYDLDRWMSDEKPPEVIVNLNNFLRKQNEQLAGELNVKDAKDVLVDVMDTYKQTELGIMGIKTLSKKMDDATGGWCDGDLSFFVARSGVGKSWSLVLGTHAAVKQKKKTLLISGEMTTTDLIYRHLAIDLKIPYGPFRKAHLDPYQKQKLDRAYVEYDKDRLLKVVDASGGVSTPAIEAVIDQVKPDIVFLDAVYRIRASIKSRDRFENMANVVSELKSIAGRQKVPIIGSTQLNRDSTKKKGDIGTEDLAMSDVLGWESTNIFALHQDDERREKNQMAFFPVKIREMEKAGKPIVIRWNFHTMEFSEVSDFEIPSTSSPIDSF